jgi:tetratricopeptide (TPR) repeat protein
VLSIDPNLVEAFHKIAQLYLKEGLSGSARGCYQSILKIRPSDQEAIRALESIEDQKPQNEPDKIVPQSESRPPNQPIPEERGVPESRPAPPSPSHPESPTSPALLSDETEVPPPDKDSKMHYHLGIAHKEMELFDYAISEFELACTNSSMKFDCCIMLGDCFMEKGDYDKSIEYYRTASEIEGLPNAKLARLYFNLGVAYESSGMISEALSAFKHVLKLDHTFQEAQKKIEKLHEGKA